MPKRLRAFLVGIAAFTTLVAASCGTGSSTTSTSTRSLSASTTSTTAPGSGLPLCTGCTIWSNPPYTFSPQTTGACGIKSTTNVTDSFTQPPSQWSYPGGKKVWTVGYPDAGTDVAQLMIADVGPGGQTENIRLLSYDNPAAPSNNQFKWFASIRPQGDWILVEVENPNGPVITQQSSQLLQVERNNGYWTNLWVTNTTGTEWYQLTHFTAPPGQPPAVVGMLGPQWSPNGQKIAFPETYHAPDPSHLQGYWNMYVANFSVSAAGVPQLSNTKEIDYPGDVFYEMQDWSPDSAHILIQTVFPGFNAYAPSIAQVDVRPGPTFGRYTDLTDSPGSWNEHAKYSPNGRKIVWISSISFPSIIGRHGNLPWAQYRHYLHNEVFLMDSNGHNVQELTWFNDPNSPDSSPQHADWLFPEWNLAGTQVVVYDGIPVLQVPGGNSTWLVTFNGNCG